MALSPPDCSSKGKLSERLRSLALGPTTYRQLISRKNQVHHRCFLLPDLLPTHPLEIGGRRKTDWLKSLRGLAEAANVKSMVREYLAEREQENPAPVFTLHTRYEISLEIAAAEERRLTRLPGVMNQHRFFVRLRGRNSRVAKRHGHSQEDMISYGFSARHWQQIEAGRPNTGSTLPPGAKLDGEREQETCGTETRKCPAQ